MALALYQIHQAEHCNNSPADVERMREIITLYSFDQERLGDSLISAINSNHGNCCAFLYSAGAKITNDTTFMISLKFMRGDVPGLKLALKYIPREPEYINTVMTGISRVFKAKPISPKLMQVIEDYGFDTVSFLLPMLQSSTPLCENVSIPICYIVYMKQLKRLLLQGAPIEHRHLPGHQNTNCRVSLVTTYFMHIQHCEHHSQADKLMGVFGILHELGGNLREITHSYPRRFQIANIPEDQQRSVMEKVQAFMYNLVHNPRSLKSLCRITLLRQLRDNYLSTVQQMSGEVPRIVIEFLRGTDLVDL